MTWTIHENSILETVLIYRKVPTEDVRVKRQLSLRIPAQSDYEKL